LRKKIYFHLNTLCQDQNAKQNCKLFSYREWVESVQLKSCMLSVYSNTMSSPPIPVPTSSSRHSAFESLSHSHPNDSGNKPVLSPGTPNRNPGMVHVCH